MVESRRDGDFPGLSIVACFGLGGRNVADGFEQAPVDESVHPFQRGELDGFQVAPWPFLWSIAETFVGRLPLRLRPTYDNSDVLLTAANLLDFGVEFGDQVRPDFLGELLDHRL